jgi:hypothetical protein
MVICPTSEHPAHPTKWPPYIEWVRDKAMNYIFIFSCDKNHMMRKVLLDDKKERRKEEGVIVVGW